jgi:hypothetical protein
MIINACKAGWEKCGAKYNGISNYKCLCSFARAWYFGWFKGWLLHLG